VSAFLLDPQLAAAGVRHGFGVRGAEPPGPVERPRQVHGTAVCEVRRPGDAAGVEADAIVCRVPGLAVGVVTADCVPILLAAADARAVAAVHAGWRGLAAGVVAAGASALSATGASPVRLVAAIGPYVGPCCYEVDEPVLRAVRARFPAGVPAGALRPGRPGHAWLDLGLLAEADLLRAGVTEVSRAAASCTACAPERFHSYRRDGPHAGRLLHFVAAGSAASCELRRS
jgi:YfiH family protein